MELKYMVYDTLSGDKVFHKTEEEALKDYNEALAMYEDEDAPYHVYLFEIKKMEEVNPENN